MKIALVVIAGVVVLIGLMFAAAAFYGWALETIYTKDSIFFVRPYAAIFAASMFVLSVVSTFGAFMSIPAKGLGIFG